MRFFWIVFFAILLGSALASKQCAAVTLLVGLTEQIAIESGKTIPDVFSMLCKELAPKLDWFDSVCTKALDTLVPAIEKDFALGMTPDETAHKTFHACDEFPTCVLYKQWPPVNSFDERNLHYQYDPKHYFEERKTDLAQEHIHALLSISPMFSFKLETLPKQKISSTSFTTHLPEFDLDKDRFSTVAHFRGSDWRGKDCNDLDATVYPGRLTTNHSAHVDHNCNGISGVNSKLQSYEKIFCEGSGQRGIVALGDSATAHFRVPPEWLHAASIINSSTTYSNLIPVIENEADWPQCSWSTGHVADDLCPPSPLPVNSIYTRLRQRNLCNHRDFQNVGVNGARSTSMAPSADGGKGIAVTMKDRSQDDQPALVTLALIGNDVCGSSIDKMTPPGEFYNSTMETLTYVSQHLPSNQMNYVVLMGLVDGRVLFDTMHDLIHPVGVTYTDLYDYLNCLQTSPCFGWMNSNQTIRDYTWSHVQLLNQQLQNIAQQDAQKSIFPNLKLIYYYADMPALINTWAQQGNGHQASDCIEPTDGFHPSQTGNMLIAEYMWNFLEQNYPEALGPINPHNNEIESIFGANLNGY